LPCFRYMVNMLYYFDPATFYVFFLLYLGTVLKIVYFLFFILWYSKLLELFILRPSLYPFINVCHCYICVLRHVVTQKTGWCWRDWLYCQSMLFSSTTNIHCHNILPFNVICSFNIFVFHIYRISTTEKWTNEVAMIFMLCIIIFS
jgi:hypothetical protein